MRDHSSSQSDLAEAIEASKNNKVLEWAIQYLQRDEKNKGIAQEIQKRHITKAALIEYPLALLQRPEGLQNGEAEPEPLPKWVAHVEEIERSIQAKRLPPPLIVTDFWDELKIADGNHRHEALLKQGFKHYWTIFLLINNEFHKQANRTNITTIILDVGGVLVQTLDTTARHRWEERLHLRPGQLMKEIYSRGPGGEATIGHISSTDMWNHLEKRFDLKPEEGTQLKNDFYGGDELNLSLYEYIKKIRGSYKTAILSDAWDSARDVYTNTYHLDEIVDQMIISAEEGMRKPDENFYRLALQRVQSTPEETIFIDDAPENIATGEVLGMLTILFSDTEKVIKELKAILQKNLIQ